MQPDTISKITDTDPMEKLNSILYKTAIESIPLLTQENFSMWRSRVVNLLDLLKIKDAVFSEEGVLTSSEELILRTVLAAKLDANIHSNVINHNNKEDGMEIWKTINKYFASTQSANRARVWNNFSLLNYDDNDVNGFITQVRAAIEKMHEVGINIDIDVVGYEIIKKFPKTPELNSISSAITHSGQEMTPDLVLDHLRLHANKQSISGGNSSSSSQQVSLFTDYKSTKCKPNAHNTRAPHPQHRCWMLHPHLRPATNNTSSFEKIDRSEHSVSSFHSSISHPSMHFVLDSGSSAHMTSNINLFFALDLKEEGIVKTSSGEECLKIKGVGSIKLSNKHGNLIFHHVLYVPNLCVNLLSVRCLVLDGFEIFFEMNAFSIKKNHSMCMSGHYVNNLPILEFDAQSHECLLSSSELLHKALGHVSYRRIRQRLGIPLKNYRSCEACAVSKVTKGSFHTRHSKASKPFEEIHLDISKSDVGMTLTQAIDLEARRLGYYPTVIHSDRGTEFINKYMMDYCNRNLIRTRYSDAYTPQQNGLAERFNRTIIESTRAILKDSGLSLHFWNEIIKTSTLTLNQIPAHKSKKSPFELFKNRLLPLDYFKPIGLRVAYRDLPDTSTSKLAEIDLIGF
ncbi:hypothetical protein VP01_74g2 [Puccinia sorghi]|uniref:Integrase catalytic domain-containing protein n=1 Tax=Puccinia sorghi TaxID=27349 RepID=A0A0L6UC62_9BASI|nr:hypothetical protein VP01_74g2 [Puccinia sorghi]